MYFLRPVGKENFKMWRVLLLSFLAFSTVRSEEKNDLQYDMDEGVVILTDANFDAYLKQNPTVLVKFYAPWYVSILFNKN